MKTSVYIATSLDGFIARKNGDLDWLPGSGETAAASNNPQDFGYTTFMDSVDVLVMGRHTYQKVLSFEQWPYGNKRVIVLSHALPQVSTRLPDTVEVKSWSPPEVVSNLRESGAGHIYVDGGKTIQEFLRAGLIDQMIITKIPVLIGTGIPLFGPLHEDAALQHLETQVFENGFVQSRYQMKKQEPKEKD